MSPQYTTFKSDASPFFFYIDVLPLDFSLYEIPHHVELLKKVQFNPIMPLPLRVDRVFNGESSIIIKPRKPISFSISEQIAVINPNLFIQYGLEKLLYLTEIRASNEFAFSLESENAKKWWDSTKYLYARLRTLEEDFTAFLNAYLLIMVKAKLNNEDLFKAAAQYCELIRDVCEKRIQDKIIFVETAKKEKVVDLYKMKDGSVFDKLKKERPQLLYPSFVDIEVMNLESIGFTQLETVDYSIIKRILTMKKYIPLLFYDDLLECMLLNLKVLRDYEGDILDPSFLLDKNVITLYDSQDVKSADSSEYSWLKSFDNLDIESILNSIEPTFMKHR